MQIKRELIDIIIPTMDNQEQLLSCTGSIYSTISVWPFRLIIVNNGKTPIAHLFPKTKDFLILEPGKNLGWTGGLAYGLKHSTSKYIMFANDDIFIPRSSWRWLSQMVTHLILWPRIGAVGPTSNIVMGGQNIWKCGRGTAMYLPFLIGFCIILKREALDNVGGIDEDFVTGDDIDLSIRLAQGDWVMMVDHTVFVFHHGFQTGLKVYGKSDKPGGWNSREMTESTNHQLIRKHGFMVWWKVITQGLPGRLDYYSESVMKSFNIGKDAEGTIVRGLIENGTKPSEILEVGCGGLKTIEGSIGFDKIPAGVHVPFTGRVAVTDVVGDIEEPLPFKVGQFQYVIARHVLEHCVDILDALRNLKEVLHDDGKLIISVPDERLGDTILLNADHVHAFTPDSLTNIIEATDMQVIATATKYGSDSFTLEVSKGTGNGATV